MGSSDLRSSLLWMLVEDGGGGRAPVRSIPVPTSCVTPAKKTRGERMVPVIGSRPKGNEAVAQISDLRHGMQAKDSATCWKESSVTRMAWREAIMAKGSAPPINPLR